MEDNKRTVQLGLDVTEEEFKEILDKRTGGVMIPKVIDVFKGKEIDMSVFKRKDNSDGE